MSADPQTVVGIDVGGEAKGFHAIALQDGQSLEPRAFADPADVAAWCLDLGARAVAVDAPCGWSESGRSRLAERALRVGGAPVQCFKTPTRRRALESTSGFYGWVFHGERLYRELARHYAIFDGESRGVPTVFETFPHAVVCALAGRVVPAKHKADVRPAALRELGYDTGPLRNLDFVDAALCAHAARAFCAGRWQGFGSGAEGYIVIPR